jgi:integrase
VSKPGLAAAVERAGLNHDNQPHFRFHDCRHTFASMLIQQGANIAYVSQQLGHSSPAITLTIYTHLINRAEQAERTSAMLEAAFGGVLA